MPLQQLLIGAGNVAGPVAFTTFFVERTVFLCLHLRSCSPFFLSSLSLLSSPLLCSPLLSSPLVYDFSCMHTVFVIICFICHALIFT